MIRKDLDGNEYEYSPYDFSHRLKGDLMHILRDELKGTGINPILISDVDWGCNDGWVLLEKDQHYLVMYLSTKTAELKYMDKERALSLPLNWKDNFQVWHPTSGKVVADLALRGDYYCGVYREFSNMVKEHLL